MKTRYLLLFILFLCTLAADLVTKELVRTFMVCGTSYPVIDDFVKFTFIFNRNAVFGLPCGNQLIYTIFAVIAVLVILAYFSTLKPHQKHEQIALAVIVAGAFGNLHDRIRWGQVVDFIEIGYKNYTWPIFNVADIAITIGMFILIFKIFIKKNEHGDSPQNPHRSAGRSGTASGQAS